MKKRIAVFANGWGNEYLREVVTGAHGVAKDANTDLFTFVDFSTFSEQNKNINNSEYNIFKLPELQDFDGVIIMANSFNMQDETDYVYHKVMETGIPAVSLEHEFEGITTVNTDNYHGMYELVEHVVKKHDARHIVFIGGPREHSESNERLKAVQDVVNENGLSLLEEDILYGDWAKNLCKELANKWIDCHKGLPDVFICANDIMAMGVCELMTELGYKVPDDVMVTGYDFIRQGQEYVPSIASVNHEWSSMGAKALQILLDKINGRESDTTVTMKTRFIPGGSCGCNYSSAKEDDRRNYLVHKNDGLACDSHFRHFYMWTKKIENANDLNYSLDNLFHTSHWMEGDNFMLCLDPEFFKIEEMNENLRMQGYSDEMNVICALKSGVPRPHQIMKYREAMFRVSDENPQSQIFIFVPVYSEERNYGFAMLVRDMDIVEDNYLYIWTRHMNQCMEQIRRNITIAELTRRLTTLSVTDPLTGVYNRAGCEKIAYPMLEEWHNAGGRGAIMIADIDRMKTINDVFGHASGDLALRTVAAAMKAQLPSDWIVSRFGGDEFFAGGKLTEGMDFKVMQESIMQKLAEEIIKRNIAFTLKLSIGGVVLEPGGELDMESELHRADEVMYSIKKEHHREIDNKL